MWLGGVALLALGPCARTARFAHHDASIRRTFECNPGAYREHGPYPHRERLPDLSERWMAPSRPHDAFSHAELSALPRPA